MITRVVKMTFKPEKIDEFFSLFNYSADKIRQFEGCNYLKLLHDKQNNNVVFTISSWESDDHLESYRQSELFNKTWQKTKVFFADKPEAWSLIDLKELP